MKYWGRILSQLIIVVGSLIWIAYLNGWNKPIMTYLPILLELLLGWWLGKQYDIAKFYSEKDALTELYNRRFAIQMFEKLLALVERNQEPLSVLLVDADNLKTINDTHGHQKGDAAIRYVADVLKNCTRSSDVTARMGGDEFVVIAPFTAREEAQVLVDRIAQELQKGSEQFDAKLTVSVGLAVYPEDARTLESLIKIADDRMYVDKQQKKQFRSCLT